MTRICWQLYSITNQTILQHRIAIDWDGKSTKEYTCGEQTIPVGKSDHKYIDEKKTKDPIHTCLDTAIVYDGVPMSGPHRPLWPDYGEYKYIPPQRWVHSLEHGSIVFIYHPCAAKTAVKDFRELVTGCLRRHIITPSKLLSKEKPFALLAWGHGIFMDHFDRTAARKFIKKWAINKELPEWEVWQDGQYSLALETPAKTVNNDVRDLSVCPEVHKTDDLLSLLEPVSK